MNDQTSAISVSTLVELIQELVEDNFVEVLVSGEISNMAQAASGHCYFTLKDAKAQLRCAMFRSHTRALRFQPDNGMAVICRGRVSLYPQRGDLQLIVEGMEPEGVGSLQLAFEQLKEKLQSEGLFDQERKQQLPEFPQIIGVVTSPTGAAIQDILNILKRRSAGVKVLLRPVRVQGEGAAQEIALAIAELNEEGSAEVLIVGRGGGSKEDLWAFNEEIVARAIASSRLPIISAVGHEIDFSISDFVADLRAPTPSAAAELVVQNRLELERHLDHLCLRLGSLMKNRLVLMQNRLIGLEKRLRGPQEQLRLHQLKLEQMVTALMLAMRGLMREKSQRFQYLVGQLDALSPLAVLGRGYAVVKSEQNGRVISDATTVTVGDSLNVTLARGELAVCVTRVQKKSSK